MKLHGHLGCGAGGHFACRGKACNQQQRPKPAAARISAFEKIAFKNQKRKILGQILDIGNGIAAPTDEGEYGPPVNFAKLCQRFVRGFFASA
ncbi:MAG: hypothetical protein E6L07_14785 [Verrucomicrobia bacterium]|nr:MAG: hypothetical protein E6L07_14785 [Verrucomicrobiota bacterium]